MRIASTAAHADTAAHLLLMGVLPMATTYAFYRALTPKAPLLLPPSTPTTRIKIPKKPTLMEEGEVDPAEEVGPEGPSRLDYNHLLYRQTKAAAQLAELQEDTAALSQAVDDIVREIITEQRPPSSLDVGPQPQKLLLRMLLTQFEHACLTLQETVEATARRVAQTDEQYASYKALQTLCSNERKQLRIQRLALVDSIQQINLETQKHSRTLQKELVAAHKLNAQFKPDLEAARKALEAHYNWMHTKYPDVRADLEAMCGQYRTLFHVQTDQAANEDLTSNAFIRTIQASIDLSNKEIKALTDALWSAQDRITELEAQHGDATATTAATAPRREGGRENTEGHGGGRRR
jgi:hypothetical protein